MAAFETEVFEDLHRRFVAPLVVSVQGSRGDLEALAFEELKKRRDSLAAPFAFRGREDSLDLPSLARRILQSRPRLANEHLVRQIDDISRSLRLSQDDCAMLIERAIDLGSDQQELVATCASMYYRECHFQALCLHDMAMCLTSGPAPDSCAVAFFAMLGGQKFVKALFEALGLLLRDLTGRDQQFHSHAGAMIQLLVETLLAYFYTFKATAEEADQVISLLPHVVMASHVPIGQGYTVADLGLINRQEHNDISIKLCFVMVCMCDARGREAGDGKLDISKALADVTPATLQMKDLLVPSENDNLLTGSAFGTKVRSGTAQQPYWAEDSQLGQFLCFAISGVLLGDERALSRGYVYWRVLHFLLDEVLLSRSIIGDSCASHLVLRIVLELLAKALVPDFRRWTAVRKLEVQAVNYRLMEPDGLQIAILRTLNRLCRVHPVACERFRDLVLHCAETFHLTAAQDRRPVLDSSAGANGFDSQVQRMGQLTANNAQQAFFDATAPWIGAPPSTIGTANLPMLAARHDNSPLYAEILDLVATVCGRGSLSCARHVSSKLTGHSNQWFNWAFLLDSLMQHARAPPQLLMPGGSVPGEPTMLRCSPAPVVVALCHLVSAMCNSHLWICQPPPPMGGQMLQTVLYAGTLNADNYGALLVELLGVHPAPTVQAACLGALAHLDFSPTGARATFASITAILPTLLTGICHARASTDGLLAIELLTCALRLVQTVPLNKGRYSMDLQPLTHVVIHYIFLKVLSDMEEFAKAPRYWRLANLALRWLRMALHGPLPFGSFPAGNESLIAPYANEDPTIAAQVAALNTAGNATAYVFRCLLSLDSPVFTRVMYLATLHGRGVDALVEGRRSGALRTFMEKTARVGLDVIRMLLQRDVLFCRLHSQRAKQQLEVRRAELDDSILQLAHKMLFAEFASTYPPVESDDLAMLNNNISPFSGRRMWQPIAMMPSASGASGQRRNPSNFMLLLEFAGAQQSKDVAKLSLFMFTQCSLRDPARVLQMLQLEHWRLQRFSADLHGLILQPEGDNVLAVVSELSEKWDEKDLQVGAGARYSYEVAEMDIPTDASLHHDMSSFCTGLSVCHAVDVLQQLADDSIVQSADLVAFATWSGLGRNMRGMGMRTTSADEAMFNSGYLRGLDIPSQWLGAGIAQCASGIGGTTPPAALAMISCRLLALRSIVLLQGEIMCDGASTAIAPKLSQILLGLDPEGSKLDGLVEVDGRCNGQPFPLEAIMQLLENPPPTPELAQTSVGRPTTNTALMTFSESPAISLILEQHASYEAALGILSNLLSAAPLRDVGFRYMVHMWPSRYQVLRELLALPWASMPIPTKRIMLAEVTLIMDIVSWEMRLVTPFGLPPPPLPESQPESIASRQRLDTKTAVAQQLQEVVRSFITTSEAHAPAHGETPFLIAIAQQLADACATYPEFVPDGNLSMFSHDVINDALQASGVRCLAPSSEGPLQLGIALRDPHVFLRLIGRCQSAMPASGTSSFALPGQGNAATSFGQDNAATLCAEALQNLGTYNETVCMSALANSVFQSLRLFFSALLYHLAGSTRPSNVARDPRAQALRAHLEALLPELGSDVLNNQPQRRSATFVRFATALISAMQHVETPAPLTFAYSLFRRLRSVAIHPNSSNDTRASAFHSLLLLLQRVLPDLHGSAAAEGGLADLTMDDVSELRKLASTLLTHAGSPSIDAAHTVANAPTAAPAADTALPLLAALLARVPASQLKLVCPTPDFFMQLTTQIRNSAVGNPRGHKLRCVAMSAAVSLCRTPALASALFESGALSAVTDPELMSAKLPISVQGLPSLETPHPAILLSILEMLVAMTGTLPTHRMVISDVLNWVEQHHRTLLELLQWVSRLPIVTATEPRPLDPNGLGNGFGSSDFGGALQSAGTVNNIVNMSAGDIQGSLLLVFCNAGANASGEPASDTTLELTSLALSGRCWASDFNMGSQVETRDLIVALCYRCSVLFSELFATMSVAVQRCSSAPRQTNVASAPQPMLSQFARLVPMFESALAALLVQMAAVEPPRFRDAVMQDSEQNDATLNGGLQLALPRESLTRVGVPACGSGIGARASSQKPSDFGLYASESARLAVCMHILHAWRHDASTQKLLTLVEQWGSLGTSCAGGSASSGGRGGGGGWSTVGTVNGAAAVSDASSTVSQLVTLARSRVNVLCTVFVHTCQELLAMHLVNRPQAGMAQLGEAPHLQFEGSREHFRHVLFIVEVSLHLLQSHLAALILGGVGVTPAPGTPRLPLVLQYLRVLQQFTSAVGGKVALAEPLAPAGSAGATPGACAAVRAVDLSYTARAAGRVAQSLLDLQSL